MSKISADSIVGRSSSIPTFPNGLSASSLNISGVTTVSSVNASSLTASSVNASSLNITGVTTASIVDASGSFRINNTTVINSNRNLDAGLNSVFNRVIQVGVNTTLQNRDFCEVVGAGVSVTLPSGPSNGNEVRIGVGTFTNIRVFASNNIMGINDDFLIDIQNTNISFIFIGGTIGWRIF